MLSKKMRLQFSQSINNDSQTAFEKAVFMASYNEFKLKCQVYNPAGELTTFTQMKERDGRANSLHYKSGFAIAGYINQLKNVIPHIQDNAGGALYFDHYEFNVIESDITNPAGHQIVIRYINNLLVLLQCFGEYLLLQPYNTADAEAECFLLKLQPNISIAHYENSMDILHQ